MGGIMKNCVHCNGIGWIENKEVPKIEEYTLNHIEVTVPHIVKKKPGPKPRVQKDMFTS